MEFKSKYDLDQRLFYMYYTSDGENRHLSCDRVEAIIVEYGLLGKVQYKYNFGGRNWYDEDEVFVTEEEARAFHGLSDD